MGQDGVYVEGAWVPKHAEFGVTMHQHTHAITQEAGLTADRSRSAGVDHTMQVRWKNHYGETPNVVKINTACPG